MPPFWFDSEDTSVIGEAERTTRQFVPTNLGLQSGFGEVATSTRRTLLSLSFINEAFGTGANGYIFDPADLSNWNEDWTAWKNLTGLPLFTLTNSSVLIGRGRWQNDLNIIAGAVIKIRHVPGSDDVIPEENQNFITGENGITWFKGAISRQPTGNEIKSFYRNAAKSGGVRYPDFVFAEVDESGSMVVARVQPGLDLALVLIQIEDSNFNTTAFPITLHTDERYIEWMRDDVLANMEKP